MQEYDESFFITKANKRGGVTWFILMIIVSVYYGIKVGTGKLDVGYFFMFFTVGWLSFIISKVLLKVKGEDNKNYKWMLGIGYLLFYSVIAWTSLDQVSYVFILPLPSSITLLSTVVLLDFVPSTNVFSSAVDVLVLVPSLIT